MDNGIGVVDGSHAVENNGVKNVILESKVEQTAVSVSDGGMDSGSEEDEVFEEATDAVIPRVDYKSVLLNEEAHAEKKYKLGDSLELQGNLDDECEIEKFEEAIGVSSEAQNVVEEPVVVVHEKVEGLVGGEPFNEVALEEKIGEQSAPEKVTGAEMNVFENDGLADNGKVDTSRESDSNAVEEIKILEDDGEVNEKSSVLVELEKSKDELPDDVNLDPARVYDNLHDANVDKQESQPLEKLETRYANGVDGGDTDSQQEIESNGEILHEVDKNVELNETFGIFDSYHQAIKNGEVESASDCQADTVIESIDTLNNRDTILKDDDTVELRTEVLSSLDHGHQDKKGEEQRDTLANLSLKGQDDDRSVELKDTTTPIEPNHHEEGCQLKDNLHNSKEENAVTLAVEGSPSSKDYTVEKDDEIQASSSDMGTENSKGSQPHCVDASVEVSNGLAEMPGKKGTEDEEVTQRTKGFIEQEIKSAVSDVTSPTEKTKGNIEQEIKSAVSDVTSPAEKIKGNIEQEIKSAASDVSSSAEKYSTPSPTAAAPAPAPAAPARAPARPAGLGRAAPLLEPAPRVAQQPRVNGTVPQIQSQLIEDPTNGEAEENDDTREKLQMIRVKFLRLAHRLGQTPHNVVVAQVLYRLGLAEQLRGRNGSRVAAFSFDRASAMAEQLEAAGQEPLDFSCTIMVLGKTGVGKSATINSIFDENKFSTDAFQFGTMKVQDVVGTVQGIKVRVIDTPGLLPSSSDQRRNEKTLHSVKRFIQRSPPDIVLYLDRLDMQSRDFGDMPLLRTITDIFGPSIWFNAIVVLTHAASAPPEGPNGTATSYDMFVTQRSHVVQQAIRQAAGDMRLMNPVSLVENHSACRTNRAGQRVLPNGQVWKPHLLLLSFASKILAEANTLLKLQDSPPGKPFASRVRAPPLPFLLSTLLQSRPQLKLPQEQFGDDDDTLDDDLDDSSESDDESEYDELPPFKRLTKAQLAKLTKAQKKAYNDELEYREKLFMKKQLKEEKRRRKLMKKMAASAKDLPSEYTENAEEESGGAASVPVPLPDLALPASFDSDNPTHRYRSLDSFANQWLMRPVLDSHGWDHDVGYEGINVERLFVVKDKIPVSFSGQATKDKKDANIQMEVTSSVKHGEGKGTTLGFDMQTLGKDIAYTLRSETRFSNYRRNKATAGLSVTHIGDALTAGVKVEDKLVVSKRSRLVVSGGAIVGRGDIAYGGSLEATLRDKDHPLGRFLSTIGLSVMDWHGDLALGWNAQTQIPIGRYTNLIGRVNLNNRGSGQVSIRLNSSEQLQIALVGLVPLLNKLFGYSQPVQFGQ